MIQRATVLVLAGVLLSGCRSESVPNGAWGGDHVVLTVTDNGGRVEFDCAHGTLDHPLQLDERGASAWPAPSCPNTADRCVSGEVPESRPARYQGRLDRQKLEFTVTDRGTDRLGALHGDPGQGAEADEVPVSGRRP